MYVWGALLCPACCRYKLTLVATQAPPKVLEPMACGVGSSCTQEITLDNPTDSNMTLVSHTTNMTNYRVEPARVTAPPYGSATVLLRYIPSSIDKPEDCVVTFSNRRVGKLVYHVAGAGRVPGVMDKLTTYSALHQGKSESFNFRNPFDDVLGVTMRLEADESTLANGEFRLISRSTEVELAPFSQVRPARTHARSQFVCCTVRVWLCARGGLLQLLSSLLPPQTNSPSIPSLAMMFVIRRPVHTGARAVPVYPARDR